ncbi:unnamed protein product [Bursaphelenchus xylophilus]|uniref:(pine wood nematode) hypothetical protein n=1 Tax=Bursaphelenchus xylophilus TaxID=6326 RepID=A0A1I7SDH6_BURXY|nr:unnamed protein product [Bursaphelenchus xylophilus]CAG9131659.1 unnamed protein product [Bursaphelenchus xylophilus]
MCLVPAGFCGFSIRDDRSAKVYRRYNLLPYCLCFSLNLHVHSAAFYMAISDIITYSYVLCRLWRKFEAEYFWYIEYTTTMSLLFATIMVVIGNRLRRRGFYQLYLQVHKVLLYGMLITVFARYISMWMFLRETDDLIGAYFFTVFKMIELFLITCAFWYANSRRGTIIHDYCYVCEKKPNNDRMIIV